MPIVEFELIDDTLRRHEGVERFVYEDTLGNATIGVGRNIEPGGKGLSDDEISYLLLNDVQEVIADLRSLLPDFDTLSSRRQLALISMRFQLGPVKFRKFEYTLDKIRARAFDLAAGGMRASLAYKQTKSRWEELAEWIHNG